MVGLQEPHRMCVFDVSVVDTDKKYYDWRHPHKILYQNEWHKKGKYLEALLEQRCYFTPLVLSVDRVMEEETKVATNQVPAALSTKWDRE